MCEPYHSIIQHQERNDDDPKGGGITPSNAWGLGKILDWGKKIKDWFHFSRLGSGHSESLVWAQNKHLAVFPETRYEGAWWDRSFKIDGPFCGSSSLKPIAEEAAKEYCLETVIGNIQKVRKFLEVSMEKSYRPQLYVERMMEGMLTPKGRDEVLKRMYQVFAIKKGGHGLHVDLYRILTSEREKATDFFLGYTRKRKLLVPEWADILS